MSVSTHKLLCGSCKADLKGPAKPDADDVITCSGCGQHDTFENVVREVKEYVTYRTAKELNASIAKAMSGSKFIKVTSKLAPERRYRFIADMGL